MLITDRFVMLNFPKTGSSFARKTLKQIHGYDSLPNRALRRLGLPDRSGMTEILTPNQLFGERWRKVNQHAAWNQIPGPTGTPRQNGGQCLSQST